MLPTDYSNDVEMFAKRHLHKSIYSYGIPYKQSWLFKD